MCLRTFGYSSKSFAQTLKSFLAEQSSIDQSTEHPAGNRRYPEEPQLIDRPTADKDCRTRTARRVDGGVGYGDADQVNERQSQPDRDRGKSFWCTFISRAEDNEQKEQSQHNLSDKTRK